MENNEQIEETQESSTEDVNNEETQGQEETRDWKAEALKYKAIAERKDKKLQQTSEVKTEEPLKNNAEQASSTIEDMVLIQQGGYNLEEMNEINRVARLESISKTEAAKSDYIVSKINSMRQEAQVKANSLGASTGSTTAPREKTIGNMTDDEHRDFAEGLLANAVNK